MKIGYDAKRFFLNQSGLGNYSRYVINGVAELFPNFDLTLFSTLESKHKHKLVSSGKKGLGALVWRAFAITKNQDYLNLDVYHGLSNEIPLRRTKVKTVVTIHDVIFKYLPETQHPINRWIYNFKTKRACKLADKIVAISEATKKDLIAFYDVDPAKIEVIYQDCLPQFYDKEAIKKAVAQKYSLDKPYILCTGTIESRKSQLDLVQAFEQLDFEGDLVLLGKKTAYFKEIESFLKDKKALKARVKVLDQADFEDFPALYAHAKLFVYPSICEGFGIPILEAMNTGVPTITTKDTVMEEVGEDAVLYFEGQNVLDLKNKMTELLTDTEKREQLVGKGYQQVLKFRKEITLTKMVALYQAL